MAQMAEGLLEEYLIYLQPKKDTRRGKKDLLCAAALVLASRLEGTNTPYSFQQVAEAASRVSAEGKTPDKAGVGRQFKELEKWHKQVEAERQTGAKNPKNPLKRQASSMEALGDEAPNSILKRQKSASPTTQSQKIGMFVSPSLSPPSSLTIGARSGNFTLSGANGVSEKGKMVATKGSFLSLRKEPSWKAIAH